MIGKWICERCGSDEVNMAAFVNWDTPRQEWVFQAFVESWEAFCMHCRDDREIDWVPVTDLRTVAEYTIAKEKANDAARTNSRA